MYTDPVFDFSENPERQAENPNEAEAQGASNAPTEYPSPITVRLRSHLTALRNLRHGFIEQHGSEPSVSLRYSQQSSSNSTISLRVGDEVDRANYMEDGAQAAQSSSNSEGQQRSQEEVELPEAVGMSYMFALFVAGLRCGARF